MGRRRMHAAFMLYKTLGYPELRYITTDCKVTELFYSIDEFCKHFDAENAGNLLEDNSGVKRRRRAASLSDSEIMTTKIMLVVMSITVRNFLDIDLST